MAKKVSRSVTSSIFSTTAIQRVIDTSAGLLNNSGADEYAKIKNECKDTDAGHSTRNKHMLHLRHKLTKVKNICNPFVQKIFHLKHNTDPNIRGGLGDVVEFNFERLFRFLVDMFGYASMLLLMASSLQYRGMGPRFADQTLQIKHLLVSK